MFLGFGVLVKEKLGLFICFFYTLFGSVLMLLAIIYIFFSKGCTDYEILLTCNFTPKTEEQEVNSLFLPITFF